MNVNFSFILPIFVSYNAYIYICLYTNTYAPK